MSRTSARIGKADLPGLESSCWTTAIRAEVLDPKADEGRAVEMTDVVNLVMLIAASIGSMALGVLGAYGVLRAGFALMRPPGERRGRAPIASVSVEGEAGISG